MYMHINICTYAQVMGEVTDFTGGANLTAFFSPSTSSMPYHIEPCDTPAKGDGAGTGALPTLHPVPCTLNPAPCTLHPEP